MTPPFFFPPLIRTLGTSKLLLSVVVLRARKLGSSNVPSVNVIELGDAEGLLLRDRRSFRTGTTAVVATAVGNKSKAYGCEAWTGTSLVEKGDRSACRRVINKPFNRARKVLGEGGVYRGGGGVMEMREGGGYRI